MNRRWESASPSHRADAREKVIMLSDMAQKCPETEDELKRRRTSYDISIFNQFYEKSKRILRQDWCEIVRRYLYQYT